MCCNTTKHRKLWMAPLDERIVPTATWTTADEVIQGQAPIVVIRDSNGPPSRSRCETRSPPQKYRDFGCQTNVGRTIILETIYWLLANGSNEHARHEA
jgi:hypothetical protein